MNPVLLKYLLAGALLVVSLIFGYLVSHSGKPYSVTLLGVHKIFSLLAGIALALIVYQTQKVSPLDLVRWSVVALTGVFFLATFVTGAVLSIQKETGSVALMVHKIAPILTTLSAAAVFFLLANFK